MPGAAPETSGCLERRSDLSSRVLARKRDARTGALHVRAPLTWIGVREYRRADGTVSRELRRPEQVRSASHLAALRRLTATADHPSAEYRGRQLPVTLWVGSREDGAPERDGTLRRPPGMFAVGHTGDQLELVEVDGEELPVAWITVTDEGAAQDIEAGAQETSLGYGALIVPAPPGATWTDSRGREWAYDAEHVLDTSDPRVLEAAERGEVDPEEIGPNHFAVAIRRGRGGVMSRLLDFAGGSRAAGEGEGYRRRFDVPPPSGDERVDRAAATGIGCASNSWFSADLQGEHPAQVAPVHRYRQEDNRMPTWWGWSEGTDVNGVEWIAFWEVDWSTDYETIRNDPQPSGWGLLWTARDPEGGVVGDPVRVKRSPEATDSGPKVLSVGDAIPLRALPEPRLFSMHRAQDESGTSGTGRVLDGVLWGDGTVGVRWRSEAPAASSFASWTDFHRVHACSHPTNGTRFDFADGAPTPTCDACSSGQPSPGAREDHYPHDVQFKISPKARKLAAALGKVQGVTLAPKADAVECTIPDNVPGAALAEFFASMSEGEAAMLDEAGATQAKLGAAEANLAALTDKVEALKPFELVGKRIARDQAVAEAQKLGLKVDALATVAAPKDAAKDLEPATPAQVRRAAVVAKLGDAYKDASEDRVTGAYAALLAQVVPAKPATQRDAKDEIPDPPSPDAGRQERRDRSKDPDPNPPALLPIANLG